MIFQLKEGLFKKNFINLRWMVLGIGKKLCETVIEQAREKEASSLRLLVYEDTSAAVDH